MTHDDDILSSVIVDPIFTRLQVDFLCEEEVYYKTAKLAHLIGRIYIGFEEEYIQSNLFISEGR